MLYRRRPDSMRMGCENLCVMTPLSVVISRSVINTMSLGHLPIPSIAVAATILTLTVSGQRSSHAADAAAGEAFAPEQIEFFESKIRPVLAESCYECHTGRKAKNGLQLDSRAGWLKGSDYRKIVSLEKPTESLALLAVKHAGAKAKVENMPGKGEKLSDESIAELEKWIAMGLPWPEDKEQLTQERTKGGNHWSFQPMVKPEIPAGFSGNPIDFFIDQKLSEAALKPAPKADRSTLYRRAHFDLLGLPPKFDEVKKFVEDPRPDAEVWPELIHRLLASAAYGERQARHWMDVARYSDTRGYEAGGRERRFVYSYAYRDWLIRSFNEDLPYDQFVLYQLAAEQLVDRNKPEELPNLAALGFLTLSKNGNQEEVNADRIDTTFRGLQALTVGCARCHDHKSDPIGTVEYYGFYGIFANSLEPKEAPVIGQPKAGPEYDQYLKDLAVKQKVVDDFLEPRLAELAKKFPELSTRRDQLMGKLEREDRRKLSNLERVVDKFIADAKMEPDKALILEDRAKPIDQPVFIRGSSSRRGDIAPRRFLSVVGGEDRPTFQTGSGRLELAQAIADPKNPLTARTIVNRAWAQHFGEGLVRTVSDFGIEGDKPSHPELLDWMAIWFVENGWSMKKLHHLILTSEAWQRSSTHPDQGKPGANFAVTDAENRLLWRQNRLRLDFEQMHDALLDVAGNLNPKVYGRSVELLKPPFSDRRAVYAFIDRQNIDPTFRIFDFSNPQEHTGKRPRTSIPMQALFMMNGQFIQQQAAGLIAREEVKSAATPEAKIEALHRAVLARGASESDRQLGAKFIQQIDQTLASLSASQTLTDWEYGFGGVDPETQEVTFRRLETWTEDRWQAEKEYPLKNDPRSYLMFRRDGGAHPGNDAMHSAIVRWIAPRTMKIQVFGDIIRSGHVINNGDGLTGKIIVAGQGTVLQHVIPKESTKQSMTSGVIEVVEGDSVDFVVEPNAHASFDSYNWQPEIRNADDPVERWNYSVQFTGPADLADPWEAYAQALLGTNEFLFVD